MDLVINELPAYKDMSGTAEFDLVAGQTCKIETSPGGEEILDVTVPPGKFHHVKIVIKITELDI
jgi:hypothetical protein